MSTTTATETHTGHAEGHHDLGFIRTYIFSTDHKMIARQFLFVSLLFLLVGGILATMPASCRGWSAETRMPPAS